MYLIHTHKNNQDYNTIQLATDYNSFWCFTSAVQFLQQTVPLTEPKTVNLLVMLSEHRQEFIFKMTVSSEKA